MSSQALQAFRTELEAELAALQPAVNGARDLKAAKITDESQPFVDEAITPRQKLLEIIEVSLGNLTALEEAHYRELPQVPVPAAVKRNLDLQRTEQEAALGLFVERAVAENLNLSAEVRPRT